MVSDVFGTCSCHVVENNVIVPLRGACKRKQYKKTQHYVAAWFQRHWLVLWYCNIIYFTFFSQASLGVTSTLASSRKTIRMR